MKITSLVLFLFMLSGTAAEMTYMQLTKIVAKPGSKQLDLEELKIYPATNKYNCKVKVTNLENGDFNEAVASAIQKNVDGKYVVITISIPEKKSEFYYIITFDKISNSYIKWKIEKGYPGGVQKFIGLAETKTETKTVSWVIKPTNGIVWVTFDKLSTEEIHFTELIYKDGTARTKIEGKMTRPISSKKRK